MKTKMRPRYYCDHCGKGTGSPSYMRRHEPGCTNNPDRRCGMCGNAGRVHDHAAILLRPGTTLEDWKAKMAALREATDECPACILAAIRQSGIQKHMGEMDEDGFPDNSNMTRADQGSAYPPCTLGFNFKAEKEPYLREMNARRYEGVGLY